MKMYIFNDFRDEEIISPVDVLIIWWISSRDHLNLLISDNSSFNLEGLVKFHF